MNGTDKMGCGVSRNETSSAVEVPEHTQMAMNGMKVIHVVFMTHFY